MSSFGSIDPMHARDEHITCPYCLKPGVRVRTEDRKKVTIKHRARRAGTETTYCSGLAVTQDDNQKDGK